MSRTPRATPCVGSPSFRPDDAVQDAAAQQQVQELLAKDDFYNAIRALFRLPDPDTYTYHAVTSVRLAEVQHVVGLGGINGLHAWYRNDDNSTVSLLRSSRRSPG